MPSTLRAVLGYVPFILFSLSGHLGQAGLVGWLAAAAAIATAVILFARRGEGPDPLALTALLLLCAFAGIALLGGAAGQNWVAAYGFITLHLLTGALMLVSAFTHPFTERIARGSVPRQYWGSPTFRAVNRRLSAIWGLAVLGGGASRGLLLLIGGGAIEPPQPGLTMLFNWIVPIVLIVWAYRTTQRTTERRAHVAPPEGSTAPTR